MQPLQAIGGGVGAGVSDVEVIIMVEVLVEVVDFNILVLVPVLVMPAAVVVAVLVVVVPSNFSMDNITSSIATSEVYIPELALMPTNEMTTYCSENLSKGIVSCNQWSPWFPDFDHNSWVLPVVVDCTSTFNISLVLAPCMR